MEKEQRRDLARMIAALSRADRENLARFIGRHGIGFVGATVAKGLDAEQVRRHTRDRSLQRRIGRRFDPMTPLTAAAK